MDDRQCLTQGELADLARLVAHHLRGAEVGISQPPALEYQHAMLRLVDDQVEIHSQGRVYAGGHLRKELLHLVGQQLLDLGSESVFSGAAKLDVADDAVLVDEK